MYSLYLQTVVLKLKTVCPRSLVYKKGQDFLDIKYVVMTFKTYKFVCPSLNRGCNNVCLEILFCLQLNLSKQLNRNIPSPT